MCKYYLVNKICINSYYKRLESQSKSLPKLISILTSVLRVQLQGQLKLGKQHGPPFNLSLCRSHITITFELQGRFSEKNKYPVIFKKPRMLHKHITRIFLAIWMIKFSISCTDTHTKGSTNYNPCSQKLHAWVLILKHKQNINTLRNTKHVFFRL